MTLKDFLNEVQKLFPPGCGFNAFAGWLDDPGGCGVQVNLPRAGLLIWRADSYEQALEELRPLAVLLGGYVLPQPTVTVKNDEPTLLRQALPDRPDSW